MQGNVKMYENVALDSDVLGATPYRLIQLMLNKVIQHFETIKVQINEKNIPAKCRTIDKALDVITYLRLCLNFENAQTNALAVQLNELYAFVQNLLVQVNMTNKIDKLEQCQRIIGNIKAGWDEIADKVA